MRLSAFVCAAGVALACAMPVAAFAQTARPVTPDISQVPKIELSQAQRELIFTSISSRTHVSTAAPPTFLPAVGAAVPSSVEVVPIPDAVLDLLPRLRGYACALVANQALIIDPKSRQVIEVVTR